MSTKTEHNDDSDGPGQHDVGLPNAGLPNVNISTIDKRWVNHDLESLKSGLLADAEVFCLGDDTPRKVHRYILTSRSGWFKTAFTRGFKEEKDGKVYLQEPPWQVDLMLYFLYTGGIDLKDEALTSGHDVMEISVELLRLGDFFQSTEMQLYGKTMLADYLRDFLSRICNASKANLFGNSTTAKERLFDAETDFPQRFCSAAVNAFDQQRPVEVAQDILADFAFAARIHLFRNTEFMSFVRDGVVPEFGNRVLAALIDGSVSDAFEGNSAFEYWHDWRVTPTPGTPSKSQGSGPFYPASPGGANASGTATPPVASGFGSTAPPAASGSGTAPPPAAASGRGRGHGGWGGLFGGNVSTGQTGGFGPSPNAGGGLFGHNNVTNPPGTVGPAFSPFQANEPNSTTVNSFQSILFQDAYRKFSAEELRMVDYAQGRRYRIGPTGGSGAFGTASGSGGGLFGSTTTQSSVFGNANNAGGGFGFGGGGFGFGTATPK